MELVGLVDGWERSDGGVGVPTGKAVNFADVLEQVGASGLAGVGAVGAEEEWTVGVRASVGEGA